MSHFAKADEDLAKRVIEEIAKSHVATLVAGTLANRIEASCTLLHWCPVGEMLPEYGDQVLVTRNGAVIVARRTPVGWIHLVSKSEIEGVTHWSPWPEVPEGLKGGV